MKKFFLTLLNGKRTYVGLGINELTESEEFESNGSESTTANNYIIKSGFPYVTATKTAGVFRIEWFAEISNSQKQKVTGFRVRYRVGTSGGYTTIADSDDGTADNGTYYPVAGFKKIELLTDDVIEIIIEYGKTTGGGTLTIRNVRLAISKWEEP